MKNVNKNTIHIVKTLPDFVSVPENMFVLDHGKQVANAMQVNLSRSSVSAVDTETPRWKSADTEGDCGNFFVQSYSRLSITSSVH